MAGPTKAERSIKTLGWTVRRFDLVWFTPYPGASDKEWFEGHIVNTALKWYEVVLYNQKGNPTRHCGLQKIWPRSFPK